MVPKNHPLSEWCQRQTLIQGGKYLHLNTMTRLFSSITIIIVIFVRVLYKQTSYILLDLLGLKTTLAWLKSSETVVCLVFLFLSLQYCSSSYPILGFMCFLLVGSSRYLFSSCVFCLLLLLLVFCLLFSFVFWSY